MNDTRESRLRVRFVLVTVILATLPCYCIGIALARYGGRPKVVLTSTPLWVDSATQAAETATALIPSFTPIFVTATLPIPVTPTLTRTATPTNTPLPFTATPTPTDTSTPTLFPSDTPTVTETLPPTVTFTPTPIPYPLLIDTVPPPVGGP